jgi:alpha-tubulin suppressor-like RCC1 family protein
MGEALFSATQRPAWFVVFVLGAFFGFASGGLAEAACGGSPVITTDKPDYGPTETVVISGTGFNCGEEVSVLVTARDGSTRSGDGTGAAGPDIVVADDNGAFALSYHLSGTSADGITYKGQRGIYRVDVRDGSGTILAEAAFSDSGGSFSCVLTAVGGVKCWGSGTYGSLGNGRFQDSATPVDVTGLASGVVQITVGEYHACALTTAGAVKCWGANFQGQLGNGTFTTSPARGIATPGDVIGMSSGVAQISAGERHTCAVTTGEGAKCWGDNSWGQLGNGTFTTSYPDSNATPGDVIALTSGVARITAGSYHTCALTTAGAVKCWGGNDGGQLGNGTYTTRSVTPGDVIGLTSVVTQISAGNSHTCALTTAGAVKCWGANFIGQLGRGSFTTARPRGIATPDDVIGLKNGVAQISAGVSQTCALTTAGGAKCWGANIAGELGNGTFTTSPPYGVATPDDVIGLTNGIVQISAGRSHTCALTTVGGVKCWGGTPVDVSGLTSGVAALWDGEPIVPWTFSGFYHPVEMAGVVNTVKGGSTVPIKFQVFAGATELTDSSIVVQPLTATQAACSGGPTDTIELTATGGTSLRYGGGHFIFNWKTPKMPGYCYSVTVRFTNGGSLSANFELR